MTENKRLIVDEDYNIVDTETGESLDDNQIFDLVNSLSEENEELKQSEDNLYTFFIQWFEEERGIYQEDFCEWWNAIQKGKTKFNEWEDDDD